VVVTGVGAGIARVPVPPLARDGVRRNLRFGFLGIGLAPSLWSDLMLSTEEESA
jgi:hypothetical protein